jgi:hypothetical protein
MIMIIERDGRRIREFSRPREPTFDAQGKLVYSIMDEIYAEIDLSAHMEAAVRRVLREKEGEET